MAILESAIGNIILLTIETSIIIYTVYKLYKLIKYKEVSGIQGVLYQAIKKAYVIVLACVTINIASQISAIFSFLQDGEIANLIMDVIFESLPTLLLFSLILTISFFWLEFRISFEEDTESVVSTSKRLKRIYIISNLVAYVACLIPAVLYFTMKLAFSLKSLFYTMVSLIIIGSAILLYQGRRFYDAVVQNYGYYTEEMKKKFLNFFVFSIFCLLVKFSNFIMILIEDLASKEHLMTLFFDSSKEIGQFGVSTVLYLIGEFGSILSLILLMQHQIQKPKSSMIGTAITTDISEKDVEGDQIYSIYQEISENGML